MRGLQVLALLAMLARVSPSRAQEALPLDLTWSAPAGCASADELRAELGRIARVRPGRSVARVTAQGRIDKHGETYSLSLRTERNGQTGERSLVAHECRSLEREVTLVLAVAFGEGVEIVAAEPSAESGSAKASDNAASAAPATATSARPSAGDAQKPATEGTPNASAADSNSEHAEAPPARAEADAADVKTPTLPDARASETSEASEAAPTPAQPMSTRAAAFLGGGVLFGTLPSPTSMVVVGGELGWHRVWLEPRFVWLPGAGDSLARGVHVHYEGFGGALAACVGMAPFASSISACLGFDAIALRGRTSGPNESGEDVARWFAAAASGAWEWPTRGAFALRLEALLHVVLDQPRFIVEGLGEVHHVSRWAPGFTATLVLWPGR